MKLKVLLPTEHLVEETVTKVSAEAENGAFTLLPRHIDFTASLVPGILAFELQSGQQRFLAVDQGVLVKCGAEVYVSTMNAVQSADLDELKQTVREQFEVLDEHEKKTHTALARLEANFIQHFMEIDEGRLG
ncbi:MAG: F0F1 ATP synthase subunit epsilon [Anaerolineae bacterium]|nr:F0F1 ATP synthase subunit epsilon [Anaerolineae bacterium]